MISFVRMLLRAIVEQLHADYTHSKHGLLGLTQIMTVVYVHPFMHPFMHVHIDGSGVTSHSAGCSCVLAWDW